MNNVKDLADFVFEYFGTVEHKENKIPVLECACPEHLEKAIKDYLAETGSVLMKVMDTTRE